MRKTALLALVVVLLSSAVGYLALDRHDKEVQKTHDKAFDDVFTRR